MILEQRLNETFLESNISSHDGKLILGYLEILERKDRETYLHSQRVCLKLSEVANYLGIDSRPLIFAGALHDIGKMLIPKSILQTNNGLSKYEWREMRKHPEYSYRLLMDVLPLTSEIALRHHRYQKDKYPKRLPPSISKFSNTTKKEIDEMSSLLSLVDFHDAITNRDNGKYFHNLEDKEKTKQIIIEARTDKTDLIESLYTKNIFE